MVFVSLTILSFLSLSALTSAVKPSTTLYSNYNDTDNDESRNIDSPNFTASTTSTSTTSTTSTTSSSSSPRTPYIISSLECSWVCPLNEYIPYCGADEVTYFSRCQADKGKCHNATLAIEGQFGVPCDRFYDSLSNTIFGPTLTRAARRLLDSKDSEVPTSSFQLLPHDYTSSRHANGAGGGMGGGGGMGAERAAHFRSGRYWQRALNSKEESGEGDLPPSGSELREMIIRQKIGHIVEFIGHLDQKLDVVIPRDSKSGTDYIDYTNYSDVNLRIGVNSVFHSEKVLLRNERFAILSKAASYSCIRIFLNKDVDHGLNDDDGTKVLIERLLSFKSPHRWHASSAAVNGKDDEGSGAATGPVSCPQAGQSQFVSDFEICGGRYIQSSTGEESIVFTLNGNLVSRLRQGVPKRPNVEVTGKRGLNTKTAAFDKVGGDSNYTNANYSLLLGNSGEVSGTTGVPYNMCFLSNPFGQWRNVGSFMPHQGVGVCNLPFSQIRGVAKVKMFLSPGWDLSLAIPCSQCYQCDDRFALVALKLTQKCDGFYDEDAYATAAANTYIPTAKQNDLQFSFHSDFRDTPNTLPNWRGRFLSLRRRESPFWSYYNNPLMFPNAMATPRIPFSYFANRLVKKLFLLTTATRQPRHFDEAMSHEDDQNEEQEAKKNAAGGGTEKEMTKTEKEMTKTEKEMTKTEKEMTKRFLRSRPQEVAEELLKFAACLYHDRNQYGGNLVGRVQFIPDHKDAAALVGLVMFTVMGLPLLCGVTLSCYSYRHKRGRKALRRIRLTQQFDKIEQRLMNDLGISAEEDNSNDDDEDYECEGDETEGGNLHSDVHNERQNDVMAKTTTSSPTSPRLPPPRATVVVRQITSSSTSTTCAVPSDPSRPLLANHRSVTAVSTSTHQPNTQRHNIRIGTVSEGEEATEVAGDVGVKVQSDKCSDKDREIEMMVTSCSEL